MKLYQRFILEPRSPYTNHGNNGKCYLVVYDKKTQEFISEGIHKKYLKFKNSEEAFTFLEKQYCKEDNEDYEDDNDYYDAEHAQEWMERNPYGYYNSEKDYGVDDEDDTLEHAFKDNFR